MDYHPQTNVKVELSNKEIKRNLENVMNPTRKGWSLHSMVLYGHIGLPIRNLGNVSLHIGL